MDLADRQEHIRQLSQAVIPEHTALPGDGWPDPSKRLPERIHAATPTAAPKLGTIPEEVEALEARRMREALAATAGNQRKSAALIGMPLRTFVTKLGRYGLR